MADPTNLKEVRAVFARVKRDLIAKYRARGAGVGRGPGGGYAIVVYLQSEADRPRQAVQIEGIPLRFEVTGPFRRL